MCFRGYSLNWFPLFSFVCRGLRLAVGGSRKRKVAPTLLTRILTWTRARPHLLRDESPLPCWIRDSEKELGVVAPFIERNPDNVASTLEWANNYSFVSSYASIARRRMLTLLTLMSPLLPLFLPYKPGLLQWVPCVYINSPPTCSGRVSFLSIPVCLCSQFLCIPPYVPVLTGVLLVKSNFDAAYFADLGVSVVSCPSIALT